MLTFLKDLRLGIMTGQYGFNRYFKSILLFHHK